MSAPAWLGVSLLLIVVAAVLLVVGWAVADETLMFLSVGASVLAAVALGFACGTSRSVAARAWSDEDDA